MAQVQRGGALRPCFITLLWAPVQPLSPGCGTAVVALPQHARTAQLRVLGWDGTCPCHPRRDGAQAGFAPGGGTGWMRSLPRSWLRFGGSGPKEGGGGDGGKCGSSWRPTHVWLPPPNPPFWGSAGSVLGVLQGTGCLLAAAPLLVGPAGSQHKPIFGIRSAASLAECLRAAGKAAERACGCRQCPCALLTGNQPPSTRPIQHARSLQDTSLLHEPFARQDRAPCIPNLPSFPGKEMPCVSWQSSGEKGDV